MIETPKGNRNPNAILLVFCLFAGALASVLAQTPPDSDSGWPREVDADGFRITVYQPQVDQWKKTTCKGLLRSP